MESKPLLLFVPSRKLLEHEISANPALFGDDFIKKGTHPISVLLNWHCEPEGLRITVDPWLWYVSSRGGYRSVKWARLEERYESERESFADVAAEGARRQAWKEFPSFERWKLLQELAITPK